jgi:uncharacterized protein
MLEFAMLFNVSGLMQEGIGATREDTIDGYLHTDGREPERLSGSVKLLRTKAGVLVEARMSLVDPANCSRCLKPLEEVLHIDFEEEFQAPPDLRTGYAAGEPPDPDAFRIDEHQMLDLTEAVRQYREAAEVMQPLCRPDCLGLCPNCGADLNAGPHDCGAGEVDNRWSELQKLLESNNTESDGSASDERPRREASRPMRRSKSTSR